MFYPAGCSARCIGHFKQMVVTGEFKKYDYDDAEENIKRYGQPEPPQYNLKNIKGIDILMICGTKDNLASPTDYQWLREELINNGNKVDFLEFPNGHVGLLMPKNLK
jgi:homoserine acetyltransferase